MGQDCRSLAGRAGLRGFYRDPGPPGWARIAGLWPVVLVYVVFIVIQDLQDGPGLQVFGRSCWSTWFLS